MAKSNRKLIDLTGQVFGRLTVLGEGPRRGNNGPYRRRTWNCSCECGGALNVTHSGLVTRTRSCGCLQRESVAAKNKQNALHRMSNTPEHKAWLAILFRCNNPNAQQFSNYGGRGIKVCEGWSNSFISFYSQIGKRPTDRHSIERINNDGGYWCGHCKECLANHRPLNCTWATGSEQAHNRRTNRWLTYGEETMTIDRWSQRTGLSASLIIWRLKQKWSVHRVLTTPSRLAKARAVDQPLS